MSKRRNSPVSNYILILKLIFFFCRKIINYPILGWKGGYEIIFGIILKNP